MDEWTSIIFAFCFAWIIASLYKIEKIITKAVGEEEEEADLF